MGFATNLFVFDPCHKDNVVVVTKIVSYLYLYLYYICTFVSEYVYLLFEKKKKLYFILWTNPNVWSDWIRISVIYWAFRLIQYLSPFHILWINQSGRCTGIVWEGNWAWILAFLIIFYWGIFMRDFCLLRFGLLMYEF